MKSLNKNYNFILNLPSGKLTHRAISLTNLDENIFNIQLSMYYGQSKMIAENLTDYSVTVCVVKPKTNEYVEVDGELIGNEFLFTLNKRFNDQIGEYVGEFIVKVSDKLLLSTPFKYVINGSVVSGLNSEIIASPDYDVLRQLIDDVRSVGGGIDLSIYYTKKEIESKNYARITDIPVKVSELENDEEFLSSIPSEYITEEELESKGYLTEHQSLSEYEKTVDVDAKLESKSPLEHEHTIDDLIDVVIPSRVSQLTNDSGFISSVPSEYVTETELNNKGYLCEVPSEYITETELNSRQYLTSVPSEYITESELNGKKYISEQQATKMFIQTDNPVFTTSVSMGRTGSTGTYSVALGDGVTATGLSSFAEGRTTTAKGNYSHAEGSGTVAEGQYSHAEGYLTYALGTCSHAEGRSTSANSSNQHVEGKYNIEDSYGKYAHILGNGKSATAKSNAHTIDWDGNAWFSGDVTIGADKKTLATQEYVGEQIAILLKRIEELEKLVAELSSK